MPRLAACRLFSVKILYSKELSFSWVLVLVIALQDWIIANPFNPFWGCLLQSEWLLSWEQTRANPRASPARIWQMGRCPSDRTEMWSQPSTTWVGETISALSFLGSPVEAMALRWWETGGRVWGAGFPGACWCLLCSHTLPWAFAVTSARYGPDPVSPFLWFLLILQQEQWNLRCLHSSSFSQVRVPVISVTDHPAIFCRWCPQELAKGPKSPPLLQRFAALVNNLG